MSEVWLITNAVDGPGRKLADAALLAGGRVVAGALEPGRLASLSARHGSRVRHVELDVANEATLYAAIDTALTAFGRIDVVVNHAGVSDAVSLGEMTDTDLRARFESNFFGLAAVAHAVLPILCEQRGGRLVQIAARSEAGDAGIAGRRAAAAALESYLGALAEEMVPYGVKIDLVESGDLLAEAIDGVDLHSLRKPGLGVEACGSRMKSPARVLWFSARPEAA